MWMRTRTFHTNFFFLFCVLPSFFLFLCDNGILVDPFRDNGGWVADELLARVHGVGLGGCGCLQQAQTVLAQNGMVRSQPSNDAKKETEKKDVLILKIEYINKHWKEILSIIHMTE